MWMLTSTMLVSSVGVAQVTHICKMALAGMEKYDCGDSDMDEHACCLEFPAVANPAETDENCCTDEIKYFQNNIDGTLQESLKANSLMVGFVMLLHHHFVFSEVFNLLITEEVWAEFYETGKQTLIFHQTFLI